MMRRDRVDGVEVAQARHRAYAVTGTTSRRRRGGGRRVDGVHGIAPTASRRRRRADSVAPMAWRWGRGVRRHRVGELTRHRRVTRGDGVEKRLEGTTRTLIYKPPLLSRFLSFMANPRACTSASRSSFGALSS